MIRINYMLTSKDNWKDNLTKIIQNNSEKSIKKRQNEHNEQNRPIPSCRMASINICLSNRLAYVMSVKRLELPENSNSDDYAFRIVP